MSRQTLTWVQRGLRTGFMRDRPGPLLVTQAAWAELTGREPLLDGRPPFESRDDALGTLIGMRADPLTRGLAERALRTAGVVVVDLPRCAVDGCVRPAPWAAAGTLTAVPEPGSSLALCSDHRGALRAGDRRLAGPR